MSPAGGRLTARGWYVAGGMVLMTLLAALFGIEELYALAASSGAALVSAAVWLKRQSLLDLAEVTEVAPQRTSPGTRARARIVLADSKPPGHAWCYRQRPAPACQRGGPRVQVGPDGGPCPHVLPARTGAWGTSRSNAQTTDDPERSLGHRAGYGHPLRPARANRKAVVGSCGKLLRRPPQCAAARRPAAVGHDFQPRGGQVPSPGPEGRGTSHAARLPGW